MPTILKVINFELCLNCYRTKISLAKYHNGCHMINIYFILKCGLKTIM